MSNKKNVHALKTAIHPKTAKKLQSVLANSYGLYLKTQNYHWNVTGPHFKALHELFELQYTDLAAAVDELAERIRALGSLAVGSYEEFGKLSKLTDNDATLSAEKMVADLIEANETVVEELKECIDVAQSEEDVSTEDMLTGRITVHQKAIWMLRSSIE